MILKPTGGCPAGGTHVANASKRVLCSSLQLSRRRCTMGGMIALASTGRGLAKMEARAGSVIAFACHR